MADILEKLAEEIDKIFDNKPVAAVDAAAVSSAEVKEEKTAGAPKEVSDGSSMKNLLDNNEIVFPKVGDVVSGEVSGVVDFGAFIKFLHFDKKAEEVKEE